MLFAAGDAARAAVIAGATGLLLAGCSGDDGVAADCDAGGDVLAVTQIGEGVEGLAEVVVADGGRSEVVTGDWVATNPSFAPDGRRLVVVRASGDYESAGPDSTHLWLLDLDGSDPQRLTEEGALDDDPHWSPDGSTIAYSTTSRSSGIRRIVVVPADGGEPRPLLPDGPADDHAPAWSADGERIAWVRSEQLGSSRSWVWVADADGGGARQLSATPLLGGHVHSVDWHPDGRSLLVSPYTGGGGSVFLVDAATGRVRLIADQGLFGHWSADGDSVYYLTSEGGPATDAWRLAEGQIVGDGLQRERFVDGVEEHYFAYPYLGLAVRRCAGDDVG